MPLGAAMFVSLSHLMDDQASPTRVASYIVSGLGFLGGGVILRDGLTVKGMTSADIRGSTFKESPPRTARTTPM